MANSEKGAGDSAATEPVQPAGKQKFARADLSWQLPRHLGGVAQRAGRGFLDHRCLIGASALSYSTILSILPLTAIVLVILSNFPALADARSRFLQVLLSNFAPEIGKDAIQWFQFAATNAAKTTAIGAIAFVVTSVMLLATIEDQLDDIWGVKTQRTWGQRIVAYWLILTLGPLLLGGALSLSAYADHFARLQGPEGMIVQEAVQAWVEPLMHSLPFALEFVCLTFLYCAIPNCRVRWRDGIAGAFCAAALMEVLKWAFAFYISKISSYNLIYGALAGVPIFLLWMYIFWLVLLAGAEIAAALAPRWVVEGPRRRAHLPIQAELAYRLLVALAENRTQGGTVSLYELGVRLGTSPAIAEENLMLMQQAGLVAAAGDGGWVLTRSLRTLNLGDLHQALKLPHPEGPPPTTQQADVSPNGMADSRGNVRTGR